MDHLLNAVKNTTEVFSGNLIVGNQDSITLFGSQLQVQLRDCSKYIMALYLQCDDDIESTIHNTILEIDQFDRAVTQSKGHIFRSFYQKGLAKKYSKIVSYIDRASLFFQLQQAQLLKEIKLLECLLPEVTQVIENLKHCVVTGENVMRDQRVAWPTNNNSLLPSVDLFEDETSVWFERLAHRIDDLRVSHTIATQNLAQLNLLYNSDLILLDRLSAIISNTFPVWENQMTLLLGLERLKNRLDGQSAALNRSASYTPEDAQQIESLNQRLKSMLQETVSLETESLGIRKGLTSHLTNIERR